MEQKFREPEHNQDEKAEEVEVAKTIPSPEQEKVGQELKVIYIKSNRKTDAPRYREASKLMSGFYSHLRGEYLLPELNATYLYHKAMGSTPPNGQVYTRFDFEGEDSIENFIRTKLAPFIEEN